MQPAVIGLAGFSILPLHGSANLYRRAFVHASRIAFSSTQDTIGRTLVPTETRHYGPLNWKISIIRQHSCLHHCHTLIPHILGARMSRDSRRRFSGQDLVYERHTPSVEPSTPVVNEAANLLLACASGQRNAARRAIRRGADVREPGPQGWLPLHVAAAHGHVEVARLLLQQGSWVDARSRTDRSCVGATALHVAVCAGQLRMASLLLRSGADPNARDDAGFCALHVASAQGRLDLVRVLVKGGARADRLVAEQSALDLARAARHGAVVGLLQQLTPR